MSRFRARINPDKQALGNPRAIDIEDTFQGEVLDIMRKQEGVRVLASLNANDADTLADELRRAAREWRAIELRLRQKAVVRRDP